MRTWGTLLSLAVTGLTLGCLLLSCADEVVQPTLSKEEISRMTDSRLLQPAREIVFETGKAPSKICVSERSGLAYVTCFGRRTFLANGPQVGAELCTIELATARVTRCVPTEHPTGIALSPGGSHLVGRPVGLLSATSVFTLYNARDLKGESTSVETPSYKGSALVDDLGTIYLYWEGERKLERIARDGRSSVSLKAPPVHMVLGRAEQLLYVSVGQPEWLESGGPPARLLVVDSVNLETLQSVTLEGRSVAVNLGVWKGGSALICRADEGIIESLPIAEDGRLLPPQVVGDLTGARLHFSLVVDEKRSLAYCTATSADEKWVLYVVDLKERKLVGGVTITPALLRSAPQLAVVSQTDELWFVTNAFDKISIYSLDDLVRRAKEAGRRGGAPSSGEPATGH